MEDNKQEKIPNLGMISPVCFDKEEGDDVIDFNEDGTLSIDIIRTGNWAHCWFGTITITEDDLKQGIKNFDNGVVGNLITFNYYHERTKNFGVPKKLWIKDSVSKFTGKTFKMLVADTDLTEEGRDDVKSGQVLNFSSEINHDYIHREVIPVDVLDEDGKPVVDGNGKPVKNYIRKRYGFTIMGGAVTNYPFITEMNPNGLGGNRKLFKDEQGYNNPLIIDPQNVLNNDINKINNIVCFSSDDNKSINIKKILEEIEEEKTKNFYDFSDFDNELIVGCFENPVMVDSCLYEREDYKAGDAKLPDTAFAIVYEIKGKSDKMLKVRKFPHHTNKVQSGDENTTLDIPRLKNAIARINQIGKTKTIAPTAKVDSARTHLDKHADATYRKKEKGKKNSNDFSQENSMPPDDESQDTSLNLTLDHPVLKQLTTDLEAKYSQITNGLQAQVAELTAANKDLNTRLESQQQNLVAAELRAYESSVSNFADRVLGGKATPATKEVIRCALRGNKNVAIRYHKKDADGKFTFIDMSLQDFVSQLLSTVGASDLEERLSSSIIQDSGSSVQTVDDNFADKMLNDPILYAEVMQLSGIGNKKIGSKVLSRINTSGNGK